MVAVLFTRSLVSTPRVSMTSMKGLSSKSSGQVVYFDKYVEYRLHV